MKILIFSTLLITYATLSSFAKTDGGKKSLQSPEDKESTSIYIQHIEKSLNQLYDSINIWWKNDSQVPDSIKKLQAPSYPNYIYEKRIKLLDESTPIKLEFNEHVLKYINAYSIQNRTKLKLIMSKSAYYFPIFEEYLAKYNLPLELKYLAAVESALDPTAVSKSGAVGLWQFMKPTSDIFDINVSSYIDERRDVYKSTDAACRYLAYLYATFNDWQLALAAYNGGPGAVKKAIARSGGKTNYWELRPYFTEQMQNYVAAFIAMNYLMNYHAEHNIFPDDHFIEAIKTDTLMVFGPLHLKNIEKTIGINYELLKKLNPVYTYAYIPMDGKLHTLVLPNEFSYVFIENAEEIYNIKDSVSDSIPAVILPEQLIKNNTVYHIVSAGENLHRIAIKYGCGIKDILLWNNLPEDYILRANDKLKIMIE